MIESGVNPIQFDGLKVAVTSDESKMINVNAKSKVIISASGMCEAGRIRHHLKHNLWRSDSTILFVGYQVPGTLGHSLLNGVKKVKLFGEEIEVKANIVNLPGISGHADRDHLTKWISAFSENPPKKVFIVHGEESTAVEFAEHVKNDVGFDATAPYSGDAFDLITGQQVAQGSRELVEESISCKFKCIRSTGDSRRTPGCSNPQVSGYGKQRSCKICRPDQCIVRQVGSLERVKVKKKIKIRGRLMIALCF